MEIKAHTDQTLRRYQFGVVGVSMGLSAALIAPPIYSGPITSAIAFGSALGMVSLRGNMTKQVADFSLVSKSERSRFLAENTGWLIATLIAGGTVFTLIFGSWSVPIRVGLGHAALVLMAISSIMLARTAAAHGKRVAAPNIS